MKKNTKKYYIAGGILAAAIVGLAGLSSSGNVFSGRLALNPVNSVKEVNLRTTSPTGAPVLDLTRANCKNLKLSWPALDKTTIKLGTTWNYPFLQNSADGKTYLEACKPYIQYKFINKYGDNIESFTFAYDTSIKKLKPTSFDAYFADSSILKYFQADDGTPRLILDSARPYGKWGAGTTLAGNPASLNFYPTTAEATSPTRNYTLQATIDGQVIGSADFSVNVENKK